MGASSSLLSVFVPYVLSCSFFSLPALELQRFFAGD